MSSARSLTPASGSSQTSEETTIAPAYVLQLPEDSGCSAITASEIGRRLYVNATHSLLEFSCSNESEEGKVKQSWTQCGEIRVQPHPPMISQMAVRGDTLYGFSFVPIWDNPPGVYVFDIKEKSLENKIFCKETPLPEGYATFFPEEKEDEKKLQLSQPCSFAILGSEALVGDAEAHRICVCTLDGKLIRSFGTPGKDHGQLDGPHHIGVSAAEKSIFVADRQWRVQKFRLDGTFVADFQLPRWVNISDIVVYGRYVYILHQSSNPSICGGRIGIYSLDGKIIGSIGRKFGTNEALTTFDAQWNFRPVIGYDHFRQIWSMCLVGNQLAVLDTQRKCVEFFELNVIEAFADRFIRAPRPYHMEAITDQHITNLR